MTPGTGDRLADHPDLELAKLLIVQAKHDEAESLLRRTITSFEAIGGPDSHDLAVACRELATLLAALGRAEEAAGFYERALVAWLQLFGSAHPEVAVTLHNLALVREAAGRVEEANSLWAQARALLESHPE